MTQAPSPQLIRQRLAALNSYKWRSYPYYIGKIKTPDWLDTAGVFRLGGGPPRHWARDYQQSCEAALGQRTLHEPWTELIGSLVLGTRAFVQSLTDKAKPTEPVREQLRRRPTWPEIVSAVEHVRGERWKDFAQRHGDFGRDLALYLGRTTGGLTLSGLF